MRTLLLLSIAAGAVILTDEGHAAQDRAAEAAAAAQEAVDAARAKSAEPAKAPVAVTAVAPAKPAAPHADHGVTYETETRVVTSRPGFSQPHSPVVTTVAADYRGDADVADRGEWICAQDTPDAREYRCRFDGEAPPTATGWSESGWADADWAEEEALRRDLERACRPDNGVGGSILGGLLGGVAGNRIAGRGNRTAGTLIGGALGAAAGGLIDQAEDKNRCRDMVRRIEERQRSWAGGGGHWQQGYTHQNHGQGWYSPGIVVTTITTPAPVITETVTTETFYETVPVRHRHAPKKRHYKPRPKPRCGC